MKEMVVDIARAAARTELELMKPWTGMHSKGKRDLDESFQPAGKVKPGPFTMHLRNRNAQIKQKRKDIGDSNKRGKRPRLDSSSSED